MSKKYSVTPSLWKGAVAGLVAGLIGSWVKSVVEPPLQRLGETLFPPTAAEKNLRGADTTGHPLDMPPAIMIEEISEKATGKIPAPPTVETTMMGVHYAFGTALAVAYAVAAEEIPGITAAGGIPAGAVMWAGTHGSVVPALGLQGSPDEMPAAWYVWELGSHLVFGLTVEIVRREVRKRL